MVDVYVISGEEIVWKKYVYKLPGSVSRDLRDIVKQ